jgi:hypothetical protein
VMARATVLRLAQEAFHTARDRRNYSAGESLGGADLETEPSGTTHDFKPTLIKVALAVPDDPGDNRSVVPGYRARRPKGGYPRFMNGPYDDLRAALRERVHIAELLQSRGVPVRTNGRGGATALCPFHETTGRR